MISDALLAQAAATLDKCAATLRRVSRGSPGLASAKVAEEIAGVADLIRPAPTGEVPLVRLGQGEYARDFHPPKPSRPAPANVYVTKGGLF